MTVTDTEKQEARIGPDDHKVGAKTLEERLARVPEIESRVRVTAWAPTFGPPLEVTTGVLKHLDRGDSLGTFYVQVDAPASESRWVHDVEPEDTVRLSAAVQTVDEILGAVDGPVDLGDTVKVLRALSGASEAFKEHIVGRYAVVADGVIEQGEFRLVIALDPPFRAEEEVLRTASVASWAKVIRPASEGAPAAPAEVVAEETGQDVKDLQIARLQARLAEAEQRLTDLKVQVGTVAMKKAKEHGWCAEVQYALQECGIDPVIPMSRYEVDVVVTATQTVTVTIEEAESEDDAREQAEADSDLAWNECSNSGWEYEDQEVRSAQALDD